LLSPSILKKTLRAPPDGRAGASLSTKFMLSDRIRVQWQNKAADLRLRASQQSRLFRLRDNPQVRFGSLPSLRIDFLGFLVRDGAGDDHILALLPIDGRCYAVLGGQLQ
jgi:hypothetical protein